MEKAGLIIILSSAYRLYGDDGANLVANPSFEENIQTITFATQGEKKAVDIRLVK